MPALVGIIAKFLVLIDAALENLVYAWQAPLGCNNYLVLAHIQTCGTIFANQLEGVLISGIGLLNQILGGLGVIAV